MSLDLTGYAGNFEAKRPITAYFKEVQSYSIPVFARFYSAMVNFEPEKTEFQCRKLFNKYKEFHMDGNYKFPMSETAFGRESKKINPGVYLKRSIKCNYYVIDLPAVKRYLEDNDHYDSDAMWDFDKNEF
jgi:hypothetical protein